MQYQIRSIDQENNIIILQELSSGNNQFGVCQKGEEQQQNDKQTLIPSIKSMIIDNSISSTIKLGQFKAQMEQMRKMTILHCCQTLIERFVNQNLFLVLLFQCQEQVIQGQFNFILCEETDIQFKVKWFFYYKSLEVNKNVIIIHLLVYISHLDSEITLNIPFGTNQQQQQQLLSEYHQFSIIELSLLQGVRYHFNPYIDQYEYLQAQFARDQVVSKSTHKQQNIVKKYKKRSTSNSIPRCISKKKVQMSVSKSNLNQTTQKYSVNDHISEQSQESGGSSEQQSSPFEEVQSSQNSFFIKDVSKKSGSNSQLSESVCIDNANLMQFNEDSKSSENILFNESSTSQDSGQLINLEYDNEY